MPGLVFASLAIVASVFDVLDAFLILKMQNYR